QDGVALGQTNLALALPDPAALTLPIDGAIGVTGSTPFSWTGPTGVTTFKVQFSQGTKVMFVVTAQGQAQLPSFPGTGFALAPNTPCTWSVQTHGRFATVDDAAGPNGMLDSMSVSAEPAGVNRTSGSFTESALRDFTTAP